MSYELITASSIIRDIPLEGDAQQYIHLAQRNAAEAELIFLQTNGEGIQIPTTILGSALHHTPPDIIDDIATRLGFTGNLTQHVQFDHQPTASGDMEMTGFHGSIKLPNAPVLEINGNRLELHYAVDVTGIGTEHSFVVSGLVYERVSPVTTK
jgi:hypothetical protein